MPLSPGTNIILRSGGDPDALSYFSRAGISSAAQTPATYDSASTFNGSTQYLSVTNNSTLQVNNQSYTFSAWINPSVSATQIIFGKFIGGTYDYLFFLDSTNKVQLGVVGNGLTSSASVPLGQWSHVACTYDHAGGQTARVYVNGQLSGTITSFPSATSTTAEFQIGARAAQILFTGSIGPCAVWKRALSASEITSLYNSGNGLNYAGVQSAGLTTNLVSYWALNETSGSRVDAAGSNTLTNNGLVGTTSLGPIALTFANSRALILGFVKGVKALGLWNNMVCWPLRSSQNAGTGTTAFSLGGLGTFNGTFTSSGALPTWGANGINLDASIQGMGGASLSALSQQVLAGGFVIRRNATNTVSRLLWGGGTRNFGLTLAGTTSIDISQLGASSATGITQALIESTAFVSSFEMESAVQSSGNMSIFRNGSSLITQASSILTRDAATQVMFGSQFSSGTHVIPFSYFTTLSSTNVNNLYSLYKSTLGVGLGLP